MPAIDAYAKLTTLAEDIRSPGYAQMVRSRVLSVRGELHGDSMPSYGIYDKADTGEVVWRRMVAAVETGYAFYVAPQMSALVTAAAESLPDEEPTLVSDPPTPQGFVWIPGGLTTLDVRGRVLVYNAALWTVYGGQVFVWWLTDKYDENDMTNFELRSGASESAWARFPTLTTNGEARLRFNQPVPKMLGQTKVLPPEVQKSLRYEPDKGLVAWFDQGMGADELQEWMTPQIGPDTCARWLLACWRLMQQSLTSLIDEELPKGVRKAGRRAGLPTDRVTVIDLRTKPSRGTGESEVEWTHRWLRRGHWRQQPYKEDGVWMKKTIWIHPTVCGPEGLPLVIRDHVYNLKR